MSKLVKTDECSGDNPNNSQDLAICDALKDANCLCRSALSIAKRGGEKTNWKAFAAKLEGSLAIQHKVMLEHGLIESKEDT